MSTESFLPDNYEVPSSGGFTKFDDGENRLRILKGPLLLWVMWDNGVVTRYPYLDAEGKVTPKPTPTTQHEKNSVRHVWAMGVFNYKTNKMEVCELSSVTVQNDLKRYSKDADYGHPKGYDVVVHKKGSGLDTEYGSTPKPPKEVDENVKKAYVDTPIDLSQLLVSGGNLFQQAAGKPADTTKAPEQKKTVTPENWAMGDDVPAVYKISEGGKLEKVDDLPF